MKYAANIISITRILLSFILFFCFRYPGVFLILYIICGISDVLDGYIARKTNTQSGVGARLDSIADLILCALILSSIFLWMGKDILRFLLVLIGIAIIRVVNVAIAAYKYRTFAIIHTLGNKITGLMVFFTPIFILFHNDRVLWFVCIAAAVSALEETLIHLTSNKLDLDRLSIFSR